MTSSNVENKGHSSAAITPINSLTRQYSEFISGFGASTTMITLAYPIHKLTFRQQLLGISTNEAISQLKYEGVFLLYRGLLPPLIQKSLSTSLSFGIYDRFNNHFRSHNPNCPASVNQSMSAMMAGCFGTTLMPLERVQSLLQNKVYHDQFPNTFHAFKALKDHGVSEYYRGLTPILLRNILSNVLFFKFRGEIKDLFPKSENKSVETMENFVSGGFLGAGISTLLFPLNVVKAKMQSTVGTPYEGFWKSFKSVYVERNCKMRNIYRGVHVNYARSLICWGLINSVYELIKNKLE